MLPLAQTQKADYNPAALLNPHTLRLRALGVKHQRPFLMLSLLSLSVSPNYKFTDKGVIDTEARRLLPTWE